MTGAATSIGTSGPDDLISMTSGAAGVCGAVGGGHHTAGVEAGQREGGSASAVGVPCDRQALLGHQGIPCATRRSLCDQFTDLSRRLLAARACVP